MSTTNITRVRYYWDAQTGAEGGWYTMGYDADGGEADDSQKVWFPVDVDSYDRSQADDLEAALREAFPDAEIEHAA
jgi:hypothetical protein